MGPTGQLPRATSIENKGSTYTAWPIYGSNRGQVMGIVTIMGAVELYECKRPPLHCKMVRVIQSEGDSDDDETPQTYHS